MEWTDNVIQKHLKKRRILIVEDDPDLAPRLERSFRTWGVEDVVIRRCVTGKTQGAIDLLEKDSNFDLICLDMMLPFTELKLNRCDDLQKQWDDLQAKIIESSEQGKKLAKLRDDLEDLSTQMDGLIDRVAGLRMVHALLDLQANTHFSELEDAVFPIPILFLTARQQEAVSEEAKLPIPNGCFWLTKPVRERHLMETAARLICSTTASHAPCGRAVDDEQR